MSIMAGIEFDTDLERLEHLDFDFEVACEVPERRRQIKGGMPMCDGNPAEWVGWRANCCPTSMACSCPTRGAGRAWSGGRKSRGSV